MTVLIRERPSTRLSAIILPANATGRRWGADEPRPANVLGGLTFSDTMPGGFEQCGCTLTRDPGRSYADLGEFATLQIRGMGGAEIAWEGRLETTPRVSGDQEAVNPGAVGYQSVLDDNRSAREIIVDRDMSQWQAASVQRKINLTASGRTNEDPAAITDASTGQPSLGALLNSPWTTASDRSEAWYDAAGLLIGSVYYAWKLLNGNPADPSWSLQALLSTDDIATTFDTTGNLYAAGPGAGTIVASAANRKFALLYPDYGAAFTADSGVARGVYWTCLAVYGDHGLTKRGVADLQNAQGFYAQDVVRYVVGKYAQQLATSKAGISTVLSASTFVIPHLVFRDPTTVSDMVRQASRFDLQDWAVWEGPTLYWNDYNARGRKWRARVGAAQLQDTGPQVDRIWNSVVVQYADVSGVTRTAGPVGSGCNTEDASLADSDPANPATVAGLTRRALVQMGTSTAPAAIKIGQTFLQQQKLRATSGQATLVGHVQDEHGVLWPAWYVRAGDQISFVDANDTSYRRIVRKAYDDATRAATIDLDSPPDALQELIERMSISVTPIGFS